MNLSRRNFLLKSAAGTAALASIPAIVSAAIPSSDKKIKYAILEKDNTILFQGDSITDAGRDKEKELPNNPLRIIHNKHAIQNNRSR